jgi:NifU-like protein involved in Fe-S cluster formation
MVSERLRAVMLRAAGAGELAGDGVSRGLAEHPVCGDRVQLTVRVASGRIEDLRWQANGCPAAMAVAALAADALRGAPLADAAVLLRRALDLHGGLAAHERHAEGLVLRALAAAAAPR